MRENVQDMERQFRSDPELRDLPGFVVSDPRGSEAESDLLAGRRRSKD